MRRMLVPIIVLTILAALVFAFIRLEDVRLAGMKALLPKGNEETVIVDSFESCVLANYPVQESYPRRCTSAGGEVFTERIEETSFDIILENPKPNTTVSDNFDIEGEAVGAWFFEGQFSAELVDSTGEIISTAILTAEEEWMTEELVVFSGKMKVSDFSGRGELVLKSANPSGLPENQKIFSIPILIN